MRLSIREEDPGYNFEATLHCKVLLDGVDVTKQCFTADEEEGKVWWYKWDAEGRPFVDPHNRRAGAVEEVRIGNVLIVLNAKTNDNDAHPCN